MIPAAGGSLNVLDVYTLSFPAGAVCDPSTQDTKDGYTAGAWDSACTPANRDIAIRATAKWSNGKLYVDFQPALRFVPGKRVTLSTNVMAPVVEYYSSHGVTDGFLFPYSTGIEGTEVLDALADSSLRAVVNGSTGLVSRRIKHFSGYVITGTQTPCDPNEGDPMCVWVDDEGTGFGGGGGH